MRTPLAWLNLRHDKARTATALAGTAFAVVLVLMQLGFLRSVFRTADILYEQFDFDVVLTSVRYRQMMKTGTLPRVRLDQAASLPEVAFAAPVSIAMQLYRNPENGRKRSILVVGVDPRRTCLRIITPEQSATITAEDCVLLDALSRPEYGPRRVGLRSQIGQTAVTVTGMFELGCGFGADGTVIVGEPTFAKLFFPRSTSDVSLGLLRLRGGASTADVVERLRATLPDDVVVRSRDDFLAQEARYWVLKTSVGVIFGLGVLVSLAVGTAIVYQVLSADIAKRMPEYAVLKAMGYARGYLSGVVLLQAVTIGAIGFIPGWLISLGLYEVTRRKANLPMEMGEAMPAVVFVLSVLMCCTSGLAALRKLHAADPAELFS